MKPCPLVVLFIYFVVNILSAEQQQQCEEATPAETADLELRKCADSECADKQSQYNAPSNVDLSECESIKWLNEDPMIGYHLLCVENKSNKALKITYYKNGVNPSNSITINPIITINTIRKELEEVLSIPLVHRDYATKEQQNGYNEWTMYNIIGDKITNLKEFMQCGTILVYEGGVFMYPPIMMGYQREIAVSNPDPTYNDKEPILYYTLKTISIQPIILLIEGFIRDEYSDHIVRISDSKMRDSGVSHMHNTAGSARKWRTSTTSWLKATNDIIAETLNDLTASVLRIPSDHQETIQVLRYYETQQYDSHWDYFDPALYKGTRMEDQIKGGKNRVATLFWYMSNVTEGGFTYFPQSGNLPRPASFKLVTVADCLGDGLRVTPVKGNAIIFYGMKANGEVDPLSLHGACPVGKGQVKWGANKWIWTKPVHYS